MSASPITPDDFAPITSGATACDHLAELGNTRSKVEEFLEWLLADDDTGNLGSGFKEAIVQQLLYDATKLGYLVMSDTTTGYLTLVEKLLLTKLSTTGAATGDYMFFNGTTWIKQTPIYAAPSSGGVTVPDPGSGAAVTLAHGFAATPKNYACFLECNDTDLGYAVGDRVDALSLIGENTADNEIGQAVTVFATDTVVGAVFRSPNGANPEYQLPNKSTFVRAQIDRSKWDIKLYAMP
jgi:hypothetical protein